MYLNRGAEFQRQGELEQALEHYRKALAICLKTKAGPEHPHVGAAYNNLGSVFSAQGGQLYWDEGKHEEGRAMYGRALEHYRKALAARLKAHGPEHRSVGDTYDSMGEAFRYQGDYGQALEHYRKALAISEKALGPEHPDTLSTVFNMGCLHGDLGNLALAQHFFARAAQGRAKSLGPTHPKTLQAQQYLARCDEQKKKS